MTEAVWTVLRVLVALAAVLGLVVILGRRFGARGASAGPDLAVLGRQALSRGAGVAVVAVGERRLLVGFGDQGVRLLTELDALPDALPDGLPDALPDASADRLPDGDPAPSFDALVARHRAPARAAAGAPDGPLGGSVLAPATWRATARALSGLTARR